ncbi:MAG TPA: hypothetical protein VNK41_12845 [Vicinamibacterales bacterium]|nr:hypothetical protein [Vicinamibacterales bacterium]
MIRRLAAAVVVAAVVSVLGPPPLSAHDGPPFPILSHRVAGGYTVDLWTDPDTTNDGSAGGQFWVMLEPVDRARELPADTAVTVGIRPAGSDGPWQRAAAAPVGGDLSRQFVALVMDREGRFDVRVEIEGSLGRGEAEAWVDATYDLRPPPIMLAVYLIPFLLVGTLWIRLLIKRRQARLSSG